MQDWSGAWLLMDARLGAGQPLAEAAALGRTFGARQVGRMETVGCKDPGMNIVPTMDTFLIHIVASLHTDKY